MAKAEAVLSAHSGARKVTLRELEGMRAPVSMGRHHVPIAHIELVEALRAAVKAELGATVDKVEVAVGRGGYGIPDAAMFGTMVVSHGERKDLTGAIGFRHSNDRSMGVRLVAGARVFVCDNMALSGDSVILREKHTGGLDLKEELKLGMAQFQTHFLKLERGIGVLKDRELTTPMGESRILNAFVPSGDDGVPALPMRLLASVAREWRAPRHAEFAPRTEWSLQNAFTEAVKELPIVGQQAAAQRVGVLFGLRSAEDK